MFILSSTLTSTDVFGEVQNKRTTLGVVPFENSTNGSVVFTLDDLADRSSTHSLISVNGETFVDVHHYLLGHTSPSSSHPASGTCTPTVSEPSPSKPRARPLTDLSHIKRIYSHPQAFGQCHHFLSTYLKGVETFEVSSTSKAAEIVSQDTTGTWAAISSQLAGELYKLDALGKNIEDRDDNKTRFLVIGSQSTLPEGVKLKHKPEDKCGNKSLVSLTVPHRSPGALADALSCFRDFQLNLTSINSRPSLKSPFQYIFFVEFEGSRLEDPEGRVKGALEKIDAVAESWRWLGSWDMYKQS